MNKENFTFKTTGQNLEVNLTVFWNDQLSSAANACPIALVFHGGGFVVGSRLLTPYEHIEDLVVAGFVAVSADYSLCPQVSVFEGPLQDAKSAYAWCRSELPERLSERHVKIDVTRIVTTGYSAGAALALCLGAEPNPPVAILDFYGVKYFDDPLWFAPVTALSQIPDFEEVFIEKIFDEPVITSTMSSLEQASKLAEWGNNKTRQKGMPKPDFTKPRYAWMFTKLKKGTHLVEVVKDGNYRRVDPSTMFSADFPPTCFIHGTADVLVDHKFSAKAYQDLSLLGVETKLISVPDMSHGFDIGLPRDDTNYQCIKKGIDFLCKYARLAST